MASPHAVHARLDASPDGLVTSAWGYQRLPWPRATDLHPGIDPVTPPHRLGIIETAGNTLTFVASGSVTADAETPLSDRCSRFHAGLTASRPIPSDEAAVEATFVNRDASANFKLGQARGIAHVVPAQAGPRSPART